MQSLALELAKYLFSYYNKYGQHEPQHSEQRSKMTYRPEGHAWCIIVIIMLYHTFPCLFRLITATSMRSVYEVTVVPYIGNCNHYLGKRWYQWAITWQKQKSHVTAIGFNKAIYGSFLLDNGCTFFVM